MKKHALIPFAVICACGIMVLAQAGPDEKFERYIAKSEVIQQPIFEKVFPGVEFRFETSIMAMPSVKQVGGWLEEKRFRMPRDFNLLYKKVADSSKATISERIEAFIRLNYWLKDPNLTIITQEEVSIEREKYTLNHRAVIHMQDQKENMEEIELLIWFRDDEIKLVEIYKDGKPQHSPLLRFSHYTDEIILELSGGDPCPWSLGDYHCTGGRSY